MDPFQIPEDVRQVEDLAAAVAAANAEADSITEREDLSDDDLSRLEALADFIDAAAGEAERRETEAEERQARADAALRRIRGEADADGTGAPGEPDEEDTPDETPDESETPPAEAEQPPAEAEQPAPQAVAAAAVRRRRAPSLVRRTRQPDNPTPAKAGSAATVIASAGIPQVEAGARLPDMDSVAAAFAARSRSFPQSFTPDTYIRHSVATMSRGDFGGLDTGNRAEYETDQDLLDAVGDERRLTAAGQGNGLVAAGGWCAPSETLYDLTGNESADNLLDLPEFRVRRGGINFTLGPDWSTIYNGVGFAQTEAQAIAGTTKPCYEIACPDFDEVRLDAVGICIKAPILTNVGYPELVRRVISGAFVAHQYKVAERMTATMSTLIGAPRVVPASGSAARSMLTAIELAVEARRQQYALPDSATMEVVIPKWVRVVLRDDLAARNGVGLDRVTNAVLDGHFADRGVAPQWIRGYQPLNTAAGCVIDFPDSAQIMVYPAGTFAKGVQDVISLDTVYDTTDLQSNVYTAVFFEEAVLLAQRGYGACKFTIPLVSAGATGPQNLVAYGTADV